MIRLGARRAACLAAALLLAGPRLGFSATRPAVAPARPDATLYRDAQAAEARLRASAKKMARRAEWEGVVLRFRKVVARYPRSGYCDNALQEIGNLYRDMAKRFRSNAYAEDAVGAYRAIVAQYPSSSLGDDALWAALQMAQLQHDRREVSEIARDYLDTYPEGRRARQVKRLLRQREPASPLPSPPPPGLASVFDLRTWSGESSTRIVIDVERKVEIHSDRATNPDRLWIDLVGTRLHPNLSRRVFPVGDGLLEQVRIAKNREDVVRVVLDFKEVWEYQLFFLESPTRLVIDVRGRAQASPATASSAPSTRPATAAATVPSDPNATPLSPAAAPPKPLPQRRVDGLSRPASAGDSASQPASAADATTSPAAAEADGAGANPAAARPAGAPEPPATNRAGAYSLARQLGLGARRIVIDAGHGGHDPGTIGHGSLQEKDLVLDIALRLARLVRQELGTEVLLTRSTDVFVPLEERTAIANSRGADLFLSIHANASRNPSARGIETYFLNFARSPHAEAVAARENAISPATLKDLQTLVKAITLNSKIDESREFAISVQGAMVRGARAEHAAADRGVHTAPFYVLIGANMPAVLAEIAFVSNPAEEKRLKTGEYREMLAGSLLAGIRSYLEALNRTQLRQLTEVPRRSTVASGGRSRSR